jgi:transcriptional repressor NrdR
VKCPFCSKNNDKVIDTRLSEDGALIRRRRECLECSQRFSTREGVDLKPLRVFKTGERMKEDFSREKLKKGLMIALRKRPFDDEYIENMLDEIYNKLRYSHEKEVTSEEIGNLVMSHLRRIDKVAYIRFASVYRDFHDVEEFIDELKVVMKKKGRGVQK